MNLKSVLSEKFVNIDKVADIIEIGLITKKNVFLYGRGGHAKSEIAQEILKFVDPEGRNSFVLACGEGLTEEKLFGGVDIAKFQKSGVIEHLVHNSFMNYKYVVFEELLDSRMNVLLSLKDILTSKKFRNGNQVFDIKTEFIIVLTNRTKQEVSEDNSIKALLERFPLEMKVEWDSYTSGDYCSMFNKVLKNPYPEVAKICQTLNESGDFVSPRTAIHMAEVASKKGLEALTYFGMSSNIIDEIKKQKKDSQDLNFLKINKDRFETLGSCNLSLLDIKIRIRSLKAISSEIESRKYSDKVFEEYSKLKRRIDEHLAAYRAKLTKIIEDE